MTAAHDKTYPSSVRKGGDMNKNNTKTVSLLSEAIVAVMADEPTKATHLVAAALRALTSAPSHTPTTLTKTTAPKPRAKKRTRPALNPEQVANFAARVEAGDTIAALGRNFGISYPTAHRYYKRALETATAPRQ